MNTAPNRRTKTTAKRERRERLHATRFATAPDAAARLSAAVARARAGIRNSPPQHRERLAEDLTRLVYRWCETQGLP